MLSTRAQTHTHTRARARTHTYTHARTNTRTHAHTGTPTHEHTEYIKLRPKHIKGSKERLFIMTQTHNMQIFGVIPFVKLQNDT